MNRLKTLFPGPAHVVLPVVHVEGEAQALRNAETAHRAGCDGVFLINHAISSHQLLYIHETVARAYPDWWVGVNLLGLSPEEVFERFSAHLPSDRTPNIILAAFANRLETNKAGTHMRIPRGFRPLIPTSWLTRAFGFWMGRGPAPTSALTPSS